jgi:hypothetical protein
MNESGGSGDTKEHFSFGDVAFRAVCLDDDRKRLTAYNLGPGDKLYVVNSANATTAATTTTAAAAVVPVAPPAPPVLNLSDMAKERRSELEQSIRIRRAEILKKIRARRLKATAGLPSSEAKQQQQQLKNAATPTAATSTITTSAATTTTTATVTASSSESKQHDNDGGESDDDDDDDEDYVLYEIDPREVLIVKAKVGRGRTACVHKAIWGVAEVAYKELMYSKLTEAVASVFRKEVALLSQLRHENIVTLVGVCTQPEKLCILTEWVPRGSLRDVLLNASIRLSLLDVINMALDVAHGMQFLHSKRVIHRDLKSHNLLVTETWRIKLADFGLAKALAPTVSSAYSECGTGGWVAPEILDGTPYNRSCDIFSFAICVGEMLARQTSNPLSGLSPLQYIARCKAGPMPPLPSWSPAPLCALVTACWAFDPKKRPTFTQIVAMLQKMLAAPNAPQRVAKVNVPMHT